MNRLQFKRDEQPPPGFVINYNGVFALFCYYGILQFSFAWLTIDFNLMFIYVTLRLATESSIRR